MLSKYTNMNANFYLKYFLFKFFQFNYTFLIFKNFFLHNYFFTVYNSFFYSSKKHIGFYWVRYTTINTNLSLQKWLINFFTLNKKKKQLKVNNNNNLRFFLRKIKLSSYQNKNLLILFLKKIKLKYNIKFFRQIWLRFYRTSSVLYLNLKVFNIIIAPLYRILLKFYKTKHSKLPQLLKLKNSLFKRRRKLTFLRVKKNIVLNKQYTYYASLQLININQPIYLNFSNIFIPQTNYTDGIFKFKWINFLQNSKKFKSFKKKYFNQINLRDFKINIFTYTSYLTFKIIQSYPVFKKLYEYKTKSIKSFIFKNNGIFFLSKFFLFKYSFQIIHSQFKKKMFSFLFPEEKKKFFFLKRKKKILTRLLKTNSKISFSKFNSYNSFYRLFKILNVTTQFNKLFQTSYNLNYTTLRKKDQFNSFFSELSSTKFSVTTYYEPFIKRIRFKPGYQRIWRQVRSTLQETLNIKFQYQKRLTKYLMRFLRSTNKILFNYTESTLDKVLIFSKLLPNKDLVYYFFKKKFIYVNNKINQTYGILVLMNDFIQLIITLWYYVLSRWFLNMTLKRIKKFKRLVFQKNKPYQYKLSKNKKTKSNYIPNWIYSVYFDDIDIKPHLEVDFFTLSTYIITEPYLISYFKPDDILDLNQSIYLLYNWKYIT